MQEIFDKKWIKIQKEEPNEFAFELSKLLQPASVVFELGAGNGRDTTLFAGSGAEVHANEISSSGVEQLKIIKPKIIILKENIEELKLEKEKYDFIYSFSVLHYFSKEKRQDILRKLNNTLKQEGRIFIACRSSDDLMSKKSIDGEFNEVKRDFFTQNSLSTELQNTGFEIEKIEQKDVQYHKLKEEPVSNFIQIVAKKRTGQDFSVGLK